MELGIRGKLAIYYDNQDNLNFVKDPLVLVEDNKIVEIKPFSKLKKELSGHDIIGNQNQLIIPGLINCHTHLSMTLFRGIADDLPLDTWLREHIWPLEAKLTDKDVYLGAKVGAIESVLTGTTATNSMYWRETYEAKAIVEVGIRGLIAAPVFSGVYKVSDAIEIVKKHHNTEDGRIRVCLALHAPYTVTIPYFQEAQEFLNEYNSENSEYPNVLLHTHLAESETELEDSKKRNEKDGIEFPDVSTPTELMEEIGLLTEHFLAAHCIHVNEKDIKLIQQNNARVSINPLSNAKLGNYMPPVPNMIDEISNLGLGTDGPASNNSLDLFDTVRFLALYYKGLYHDPTLVKAPNVFKLATIGGARALNWQGLGSLESGSIADVITINLKKTHLSPITSNESVLNHFAYSMKGTDVYNVIADGKIVLENGEIKNIDISQSISEMEEASLRLIS
jgi:5-methylthioadenosine/S-adenosylhomocysteine deaminase